MEKTVLIADDHPGIVDILTAYLKKEGFHPYPATDGEQALELYHLHHPTLVLLDVMMPKMDGYSVCREIRKESDTPILLITARSEDVDIIMGLDNGADDYILKPFNPPEVMARIRAVLRRVEGAQEKKEELLSFPGLSVALERHEVLLGGEPLRLTRKEIDLLWLLASNPNRVFSRENLLLHIWGYDYVGDARTVDTHVKRLRAKLESKGPQAWALETVWGVGYKFEVPHET